MSGTRQYHRLSAETLDTLLRLISEDELTPKQIAERAGVPRQKVYEYRKKLKDRRKSAPLTDISTLVIHQRVVFRPDATIENPEDVNGPSLIKPDFGYCPGCGGVATPYRVEIANHRRGSSSLVTFHLDRDDSRPEHKTVGQSASAYLSVDEAKQIMQALQQAIKEADDE